MTALVGIVCVYGFLITINPGLGEPRASVPVLSWVFLAGFIASIAREWWKGRSSS